MEGLSGKVAYYPLSLLKDHEIFGEEKWNLPSYYRYYYIEGQYQQYFCSSNGREGLVFRVEVLNSSFEISKKDIIKQQKEDESKYNKWNLLTNYDVKTYLKEWGRDIIRFKEILCDENMVLDYKLADVVQNEETTLDDADDNISHDYNDKVLESMYDYMDYKPTNITSDTNLKLI